MTILNFLTNAIIFVFSLVIHEIAHARTAYYLGDPTAKNMGRLSLNPLKHLSLINRPNTKNIVLFDANLLNLKSPLRVL